MNPPSNFPVSASGFEYTLGVGSRHVAALGEEDHRWLAYVWGEEKNASASFAAHSDQGEWLASAVRAGL